MMFVYGSRLYGKVDVVPGLFHVETRFGHLNYVPLFPLESFVIFSKNGDSFNGVKIPISFKSVCYAWLRAAMVVASIVCVVALLILLKTDTSACVTAGIVGVSCLATFAILSFHKGSTHASYRRAYQISQIIGLSPEGLAYLETIYQPQDQPVADPFLQENSERFNADL